LSTRPVSIWINFRRLLPGLVISLLAIFVLSRLMTWHEVRTAFTVMDLRGLPYAALLYLVGLSTRALAWQTLLQQRVSFGRAFMALNQGYLLNNIFPFRLGELGRAALLGQATGVSPLYILSTIVLERAYDLAIAAGLLLASLPLVLGLEAARPVAYTTLLLVGLGLFALFLAARYRDGLKLLIDHWSRRFALIQRQVLPRLDALLDGLGILTHPTQFILSVGLIAITWLCGMAQYYALLRFEEPTVPFWWTGFIVSVVSLGVALPSAPASLGVFEATAVGALTILGIAPAQALAFAIVVHLIHLILSSAFGVIALMRDGETLAGLYRRVKHVR
jgi:glycosyltransferase 2 family protein